MYMLFALINYWQIDNFLVQMKNYPLDITAYGFFQFDNGLTFTVNLKQTRTFFKHELTLNDVNFRRS